jgi:hypothetical protein
MALKFNPFTGTFDFTGSGGGGGGSAFFAGEVATYADLPLDGTAALNSRWLVRSNSGTWPFSSYKQAGVYVRKATAGASRDNDYQLTDTSFFDVMSDNKFLVFDNSDATKGLAFDVGTNVPTSSTVTLTVPAASGTIARTETFAAPPAIGNTTAAAGTFTTLTANNGTLTASAPVLNLSQTWNNAAVAFTAINLDITNTASNLAGSKMVNFSVGGANIFSIYRSTNSSFAGATMVEFGSSGLTTRIRTRTGAGVGLNFENTVGVGSLQFGAGASTTGGDLILVRDDAANTLGQRNGTAAQEYRIYNTHTSATNHERGFLKWSSNVFQIGTEKGSAGGTARGLELRTDNVARINIGAAGEIGFFGAAAAAQPAAVADATDAASTQDRLNDLLARLRTLGLIAT